MPHLWLHAARSNTSAPLDKRAPAKQGKSDIFAGLVWSNPPSNKPARSAVNITQPAAVINDSTHAADCTPDAHLAIHFLRTGTAAGSVQQERHSALILHRSHGNSIDAAAMAGARRLGALLALCILCSLSLDVVCASRSLRQGE
jgi:hypothetical protein